MFDISVILLLLAMALFSVFLLRRAGLMDSFPRAVTCVLLTVLAFVIRWAVLDYGSVSLKKTAASRLWQSPLATIISPTSTSLPCFPTWM